jgi:hypothetical protein
MKTTTPNKIPVSVMGAMLQQVTISKPTSKPATVAKATPKQASKAVTTATIDTASKPATEATNSPLSFAIVDYARPKAGAALFAHTSAFLKLSGMNEGKAYPRNTAVQVVGQTAVKYHAANGNFESTSAGLTLTAKGQAFFMARNASHPINPELEAAFVEVMTTGNLNDKANVKSTHSRVAIK